MLLSNMAESQVVVLQPAIELGTIHRRSLRQVDWVFDDGVEEVQAIGNSADVAESFGRRISWEGCGTLPACGGKGEGEEERFHSGDSEVDFSRSFGKGEDWGMRSAKRAERSGGPAAG